MLLTRRGGLLPSSRGLFGTQQLRPGLRRLRAGRGSLPCAGVFGPQKGSGREGPPPPKAVSLDGAPVAAPEPAYSSLELQQARFNLMLNVSAPPAAEPAELEERRRQAAAASTSGRGSGAASAIAPGSPRRMNAIAPTAGRPSSGVW